ncbi:hypothetical protein [Pseudonocardia lacus]|uniref:hypothetical protein n=1 Tax=Pseudonocardia lacus TaxID=2835865 RepID=UPI001BDDBF27|nr:hypothetical protein [Pseudonocardia lacus]
MSAVSRFRLFGRPPEPTSDTAAPQWSPTSSGPPPPVPGRPATGVFPAVPGPSTGLFTAVPPPAGSDGAASPFGGPPPAPPRPHGPRRRYPGDPPTNPFGYPPVAGPAAGSRTGAVPGSAGPAPHPDRAEATALAGAFAADYLSWDEDDPARRGRVLATYLPATGTDPARLGWSGRGRQRAEFVLPGRVRPDGEGRVLVDVRVRVTPYRPVGPERPAGAAERDAAGDVGGIPAAAPAPTAPGWRSMASCWVRLTVPVVLDGERLLVDAWEELIGADLPLPGTPEPRPEPVPEDHALDDDEPVVQPAAGALR